MVKTFKLTLEYDGTDFNGWQLQTNAKRTVQGELEAVLFKIFKKRVPVIGSGRTDSGVHARGQVAHFRVVSDMPCDEFQRAFNYNLPPDISVLRVEPADEKFHAQLSAKKKTYSYSVLNRPYASALLRRYCCFYPRKLNIRLMREEAAAFIGHHDFSSFANVDPSRKGDAQRTISRLDIVRRADVIVFYIESDGFLYKMVRNIVGTLLEVASGRFPPGSVNKMLRARDRRAAGVAAVAQGLCLEEVKY
ncbi:MAG: tRNA pseudouridine(38-40) synthase TruA [Candidatus Omnitrophica bacterium]|nr:tRNA pseudouridine(38-40) synthase TruA [Candidatus Omnitrophota bacterium]